MAKNKKASWLFITLGAVVALGAIMAASRLFFNDEAVDRSELGSSVEGDKSDLNNESAGGNNEVDRSKLGVSALQAGINVEGYEIMLAYEDADKILGLCRSAIENSDSTVFEPGYTYECDIIYIPRVECGDYDVLAMFYDCSENPEDDVLFVLWNWEAIVTVKQSGIFGKATGFHIHSEEASQEEMYFSEWNSTKLTYGARDLSNGDDMILDSINDGLVCMPDEIIDLVRLVAPAN